MSEDWNKWETLPNENLSSNYRMKVPGGWIFLNTYSESRCCCFIPDPLLGIEVGRLLEKVEAR